MKLSQLPNLITLSRIALVPVLILMLKDREYAAALAVFFLAGLSDGLDGFIAKRFGLRSQLGAVLDPLADKTLLVTSYVMLTILGHVPFWLMLAVVFRDLLIVGGYLIYTTLFGAVQMQPSGLSKFNTLMQIALVVALLAQQAAGRSYPFETTLLVYAVFATTVASGVHYLWTWGVMKEIRPADAAAAAEGDTRE
jgi:cardiolipin synthase